MDFIWESERLVSGWLLPVGSALIALGLTSIGAAVWLHLRSGSRVEMSTTGGRVDALDSLESVNHASTPRRSLATDEDVLAQLDEQILRLETELEVFELLSRSQPCRSFDAETVEVRFVGSRSEASSPETRALAALVARGH